MQRIQVDTVAGTDILAGAAKGLADLSILIGKLPFDSGPHVVALDFQSIQVATSSYLREFVVGLRDYSRRNRPEVYPIVANANAIVTEELLVLLRDMRDALVVCDTADDQIITARTLGVLDAKEKITLEAVLNSPEIDAVSLAAKPPDGECVSANAWSNRLAALVAKRIIIECRQGRKKTFAPVLKELTDGS
jgi:hypothetical protein